MHPVITEVEQNKFKVLAVNDDRDFCECCGKQGLKKVVWIENTTTQEIQHFGVVCASNPAKAFGLNAEIKRAARTFQNKLEARWSRAHRLYRARGGKYVSDGTPLHLGGSVKPEDSTLIQLCWKESEVLS